MPKPSVPLQLTIYGDEVPMGMRAPAALSRAQRDILRTLANFGILSSTAAGRILHAHREDGCDACRHNQDCKYASSDGSDALKRLMNRGLVRRVGRGRWKAVS